MSKDQGMSILPTEIEAVVSLTSLSLRGNRLRGIPPQIGKLTQLHELDLRDNQLAEIPWQIGSLTQLKALHIEGFVLYIVDSRDFKMQCLNFK